MTWNIKFDTIYFQVVFYAKYFVLSYSIDAVSTISYHNMVQLISAPGSTFYVNDTTLIGSFGWKHFFNCIPHMKVSQGKLAYSGECTFHAWILGLGMSIFSSVRGNKPLFQLEIPMNWFMLNNGQCIHSHVVVMFHTQLCVCFVSSAVIQQRKFASCTDDWALLLGFHW